jgi:hypothetical protein
MNYDISDLMRFVNDAINLPTSHCFVLVRLIDINSEETTLSSARCDYLGGTFLIQLSKVGLRVSTSFQGSGSSDFLGPELSLNQAVNAIVTSFDTCLHGMVFKEAFGDGFKARIYGISYFENNSEFEILIEHFAPSGVSLGFNDVYGVILSNKSELYSLAKTLTSSPTFQKQINWWPDFNTDELGTPIFDSPKSVKDILTRTIEHLKIDITEPE